MDSRNDKVCETVPMILKRRNDHVKIKNLGMKFIAVVTNLWTDYVSLSIRLSRAVRSTDASR